MCCDAWALSPLPSGRPAASVALRRLAVPLRGFSSRRHGPAPNEPPKTEREEKEEKQAPEPETSQDSLSWGQRFIMLGAALRGAAFAPRLAAVAPALRFAGPGAVAVGAVVSAYEIGGWRLIAAVPSTIGLGWWASNFNESRFEENFKKGVVAQLSSEQPDLPEDLVAAVQSSALRNYETNRCRLDAETRSDGEGWRIEIMADRSSFMSSWKATSIKVMKGRATWTAPGAVLHPQTRSWDPTAPPMRWTLLWQGSGLPG